MLRPDALGSQARGVRGLRLRPSGRRCLLAPPRRRCARSCFPWPTITGGRWTRPDAGLAVVT